MIARSARHLFADITAGAGSLLAVSRSSWS
jgi:hypothetical protein